MIQANELRIGNYLEYFQPHDEEWQLEQVDAYQNTLADIDGSELWRPIPLTEEWLVRFGFEIDKDFDEGGICDYRYVFYKNNKTLSLTSNWFSEDESYVNYTEGGIDVFYVHQLQNLYFTLTQTELTLKDNV